MLRPENVQIAETLEQIAQLLEIKRADPFCVAAYRRAARSVAETVRPLWQLFAEEGLVGIRAIQGIGPTIGAAVAEYLESGRVGILERLKAELAPEDLFPLVPQLPSVELILEVDAEYRRRAQAGELKKIAPRRFNPGGKAWLPLLHTQHGGWTFTGLYSNTAVAHELGMTGNWVVIFYEQGNEAGQCTVVTERRGLMAGKRVVRGRESECRAFYYLRPVSGSADHPADDPSPPFAAAG